MINWFNLGSIKEKLRKGSLSGKEGFQYLLANFMIFGTSAFFVTYESYGDPGVLIVFTVLHIIGLALAFRANQKGDGKDFLNRFISLHFLVGIRFYIGGITAFALFSLIARTISNPAVKGFILGGMLIALGFGFYIYLAKSIKDICSD